MNRRQLAAGALIALILNSGVLPAQQQPVIGLITKTETNPFFVKMREGAQAASNSKGARLLTGAGKADGDNAGQMTAMENMVAAGAKAMMITPNEPTAAGAFNALKRAGKDKNVIIVSVDGGCQGIADVAAGKIAATSQQYPLKMAEMGVEAAMQYIKTGKKPSGYTDTGVTLIASKPMSGIKSTDVKTGAELCWGKK